MFLIIQFPPSIPLKSLVDSFDYFFIPKLYVAILCHYKGLRNSFLVNVVPILYPLKKPEEQRFSGVFRVSKWEPLPRNGLRAAQKPFFFCLIFCSVFGLDFSFAKVLERPRTWSCTPPKFYGYVTFNRKTKIIIPPDILFW